MSTYNPKEQIVEEKTAIAIMFRKATNIQVRQKISPSNIKLNQVCENRKPMIKIKNKSINFHFSILFKIFCAIMRK